jgi:hypothetical protein
MSQKFSNIQIDIAHSLAFFINHYSQPPPRYPSFAPHPTNPKMCHQPITIHTCSHHEKHKPSFCKYRFNLFHEVEPQYHNVKSACSACKDGSPRQEEAELSEDEKRHGGSNWKKKLRKLRRRRRDLAAEVDSGWDGDVLEEMDDQE